jgi:hypothetical protein
MHQTCYSYDKRSLAVKLGLTPRPEEWVEIEVDEGTVDVMIRSDVPVRKLNDSEPAR